MRLYSPLGLVDLRQFAHVLVFHVVQEVELEAESRRGVVT